MITEIATQYTSDRLSALEIRYLTAKDYDGKPDANVQMALNQLRNRRADQRASAGSKNMNSYGVEIVGQDRLA